MRRQPFFAVRVVIQDPHGSTYSRDYNRIEARFGKQAWVAYAIGDLLMLVSEGQPKGWTVINVEEVYPEQVQANRQYHHTTH